MPNKGKRLTTEYYYWHKAVVERDENQCQFPKCGSSKDIEVHHILTYAHNPALRTDVSNGICLCRVHHKFITGQEEYYAIAFLDILRRKHGNSGHKRTEST